MRHVVTPRNLSLGPQGPFFSVLDQYQSGLVVVWGDYINLKKVDSKRVLSGEKPIWPDGRAPKRLLSGEMRVGPDETALNDFPSGEKPVWPDGNAPRVKSGLFQYKNPNIHRGT